MLRLTVLFITGLLLSLFTATFESKAQTADEISFERSANEERTTIPFPHLREADAHYVRRIERIMDTREKQNLSTRWPRNPLGTIVYEAATEEEYEIEVYRDPQLTEAKEPGEIEDDFSWEEIIEVTPDPDDPYYTVDSVIANELQPDEDIDRYRILEEWIFDKQHSQFFPRILAIAPLYNPMAEGQELEEQELFWIRFDDLREIIINETMYNRHNDAMQLTYYDFFEMRLFSSYITKEPNEFDLRISDFDEYDGDPFRALLESERIREELFNEEHDLWEY